MSKVEIHAVEREFKYGALVLEDPDSNMTPEQVKDYYADVYPELTQAGIEGPAFTDTKKVYEFKKTVGTKGLTAGDLAEASQADADGADYGLMEEVNRIMEASDGEAILPPSEAQGMV